MFNAKLMATLSLGLLAAACAGPYDRQATIPGGPGSRAQNVSERNCIDYGFTAGSASYDRCVQREMRSREAGRVSRDYAEARLLEDARNACYDYGLQRGSQRYDNCIAREVEARRYREQSETTPPAQHNTYVVPARSPTPYVGNRSTTTGVVISRDEYGFRYDDQGNRIDGSGRIVSTRTQ